MFQFTGSKTFRVNIGNLFQLQRALQRQREHSRPTNKQRAGIVGKALGNRFNLFFASQHIIGLTRCRHQQISEAGFFLSVNRAFGTPQPNRQCRQRAQLGGKGFGRGDTDFRPGIGRESDIHFPRHGAFRHIDHANSRQAMGFAMGERGQRVGCLA